MYVIRTSGRGIIVAPEFTIQITQVECVFMMIERVYIGHLRGLILPINDIISRKRYYDTTSPICNTTVFNFENRYVYNLIGEYAKWTIPDFIKQCDIMNLLCEFMY